MKVVTAAEMREIDRIAIEERRIPSLTLMENAGRVVTEEVIARFRPKRVAIVTGKGNNAGDGFVVARLMSEQNIAVVVHMLTLPEKQPGDALTNYEKLPPHVQKIQVESGDYLSECLGAQFDCVVDAIMGTGAHGAVYGLFGEAIDAMNASGIPIAAVDVPSGVLSDGGPIGGPVIRASLTITLGLPKLGTVLTPMSAFVGRLMVRNIGFTPDLLENDAYQCNLIACEEVAPTLVRRPIDAHKGTFGSALIIAGSRGMTGAAVLSAHGAMRSGTGLVFVAFPEKLEQSIETMLIDPIEIPIASGDGWRLGIDALDPLLTAASERKAIALGPGLGKAESTRELTVELCRKINKPMVIDADGLNCLAGQCDCVKERRAPTVLTPHPGELSRLLDVSVKEIQANRIKYARLMADEYECVVVLKGAGTVIALPDGDIHINPTGNHGMAKGGSGDILTGLIVGMLAQGMDAFNAARASVFLHGLAGDKALRGSDARAITAMDIVDSLGQAYASMRDAAARGIRCCL